MGVLVNYGQPIQIQQIPQQNNHQFIQQVQIPTNIQGHAGNAGHAGHPGHAGLPGQFIPQQIQGNAMNQFGGIFGQIPVHQSIVMPR